MAYSQAHSTRVCRATIAVALVVTLTSSCKSDAPAKMLAAQPNPLAQENTQALELWSRSCASCHVTGVAGAPKAGVIEDWQKAADKGIETLVANTIQGYNMMPPLGYCMSCERSDFEAMIRFMAPQLGGLPSEQTP